MIAPCTSLPTAAPTGRAPNPPVDGRDAVNPTRGVGAAAGNLHLTPAEEEAVAAYLGRVWRGATGLTDVPGPEQLFTLVDLTLRKAREAIAERIDDADIPY
ncbi:hypothetical protein [Novosphingobium sp. fls2-241-R2A-195]|uniref:hypothetical protein n=1 Tax=Novosphingobium sp. fls2-241-R2A-195 TaxID=3040296 RepID=UPI0025518604|nr:hypothetical protein [Novosphingobium sp. fls2-241-R2A-195]